jgi:rhodanese-related sulfurtransferase
VTLRTIGAHEAKRLIDDGAILVDIREGDEHAREHIPGVRHLALSTLDEADLAVHRGRAAEHCDELAPPHSMTSSARRRIAVGNSTPITLAVLRLMTSSKFETCSTGRLAAFAPLKILAI